MSKKTILLAVTLFAQVAYGQKVDVYQRPVQVERSRDYDAIHYKISLNVDLDKKWSRVQIDVNSSHINTDYNYVPGPPVYRKYDMGETDVLVMPNYRILPSSATTQSELSIDIVPINTGLPFWDNSFTSCATALNFSFSVL